MDTYSEMPLWARPNAANRRECRGRPTLQECDLLSKALDRAIPGIKNAGPWVSWGWKVKKLIRVNRYH